MQKPNFLVLIVKEKIPIMLWQVFETLLAIFVLFSSSIEKIWSHYRTLSVHTVKTRPVTTLLKNLLEKSAAMPHS
jgi:hypothetical protein